jgi:hypothetical protein
MLQEKPAFFTKTKQLAATDCALKVYCWYQTLKTCTGEASGTNLTRDTATIKVLCGFTRTFLQNSE